MGPVIPSLSQLGEAIRLMRREKTGLTVEKFALEVGTDYSYLSGIEREGRNLTWNKLSSIVEVLGVNPSELVACAEKIARTQQAENQDNKGDG